MDPVTVLLAGLTLSSCSKCVMSQNLQEDRTHFFHEPLMLMWKMLDSCRFTCSCTGIWSTVAEVESRWSPAPQCTAGSAVTLLVPGLPKPPPREEHLALSMSTNNVIMNGDEDEEFTAFVAVHAGALRSSGIPQTYWRSLHHKITSEVCKLLSNIQHLTLTVWWSGMLRHTIPKYTSVLFSAFTTL